ncbi:cofactor-independent phosphoglycerate mutase [Alistipes sp.]|uniref:cofactor-independent phosphoglycerate mutase n=1 Tax=Alistipes sp. TaxID=1872444 RepID=UPI003AF812B0
MKYIIVLGDGMADEPIEALENKTPLQAVSKPAIDWVAAHGRSGMLATVPAGFAPGSEIANLSVLGYDVPKVFEGRGSLEAASMGVKIEDGEMAMRCNLITIEDGKIKNHSAGHISNAEAAELIAFLQKELGGEDVNFFPGVSYRHLLKIKGGSKRIVTTPPHDVPGTPYKDVLVRAADTDGEPTARQLNELIERSMTLLENHPVNLARKAAGKDPANSIWPWSPGYRPQMQTLMQRYGIGSGVVISAVDLIKGIGVYAGLESIDVEGATGLYNTNYEGKAQAAIEALRTHDFVFLHIEASDEAGHEGDVALKMKTIEYLDRRIVKPILDAVSTWNEPVSIAILPDHPTPCALRTHTSKPIPFTIYRTNEPGDEVQAFDEFAARKGSYGDLSGDQFMERFILRK